MQERETPNNAQTRNYLVMKICQVVLYSKQGHYLLSVFSGKVTIKNYMRALIVKFHYGKKEQSLIQEKINRGLSFIIAPWIIGKFGWGWKGAKRQIFKNALLVPMKLYVILIGPQGNKSECIESDLCYLPCCLYKLMVAFQNISRVQFLFLKKVERQ